MKQLKDISRDDLRELLGKGWLTHDGMWFYTVNSHLGTEATSRLNKQAIKAMAPFEVQRLLRIMEMSKEDLKDTESVVQFMRNAMSLILPDSVVTTFHLEVKPAGSIRYRWQKNECFAYKGISRIGVISKYECGVMYRIECWMRELGLQFKANPELILCQMHETGCCEGEYLLSLNNNVS